jgi:hypothetical protein
MTVLASTLIGYKINVKSNKFSCIVRFSAVLGVAASSDIATPYGAGWFFFKSRFRVEFLIFWALVLVVFAGHESGLRARPGLIS